MGYVDSDGGSAFPSPCPRLCRRSPSRRCTRREARDGIPFWSTGCAAISPASQPSRPDGTPTPPPPGFGMPMVVGRRALGASMLVQLLQATQTRPSSNWPVVHRRRVTINIPILGGSSKSHAQRVQPSSRPQVPAPVLACLGPVIRPSFIPIPLPPLGCSLLASTGLGLSALLSFSREALVHRFW